MIFPERLTKAFFAYRPSPDVFDRRNAKFHGKIIPRVAGKRNPANWGKLRKRGRFAQKQCSQTQMEEVYKSPRVGGIPELPFALCFEPSV